jgi:hypothetical protein
MEPPAFLLEREDELYNRRMEKIEKKKEHGINCMRKLLCYHPEIPLTLPQPKEEIVGWRIRDTSYRDENDDVISVSGNRFAVVEQRDDGIMLRLYIYDRDYKFKGCEYISTEKLLSRNKSYDDIPVYDETKLFRSEEVVNFHHSHHVSLVFKGGFLNVIAVNLVTRERRRYILCIDRIKSFDLACRIYPDCNPSSSTLAEVHGTLYYFHENEGGISAYQCDTGKKVFTLASAKELVKVISRKGYVVVVCRVTITVVWREVLTSDYSVQS